MDILNIFSHVNHVNYDMVHRLYTQAMMTRMHTESIQAKSLDEC